MWGWTSRAVSAKVCALLRPKPRQDNNSERNDDSKKSYFALVEPTGSSARFCARYAAVEDVIADLNGSFEMIVPARLHIDGME